MGMDTEPQPADMKTSLTATLSIPVLLAAYAVALLPPQARAATESENEYNRQYRSNYEIPLGADYTGRSPYMKGTGQPAPPPPPPPPPPRRVEPPPPPPRLNCSDPTVGLIRMIKKMRFLAVFSGIRIEGTEVFQPRSRAS